MVTTKSKSRFYLPRESATEVDMDKAVSFVPNRRDRKRAESTTAPLSISRRRRLRRNRAKARKYQKQTDLKLTERASDKLNEELSEMCELEGRERQSGSGATPKRRVQRLFFTSACKKAGELRHVRTHRRMRRQFCVDCRVRRILIGSRYEIPRRTGKRKYRPRRAEYRRTLRMMGGSTEGPLPTREEYEEEHFLEWSHRQEPMLEGYDDRFARLVESEVINLGRIDQVAVRIGNRVSDTCRPELQSFQIEVKEGKLVIHRTHIAKWSGVVPNELDGSIKVFFTCCNFCYRTFVIVTTNSEICTKYMRGHINGYCSSVIKRGIMKMFMKNDDEYNYHMTQIRWYY